MGNLSILLRASLVASVLTLGAAVSQAADGPKIAVDLTTLTSPFWTAYNRYIATEAKAQGVDLLQPFNSEFDTSKQHQPNRDWCSVGIQRFFPGLRRPTV